MATVRPMHTPRFLLLIASFGVVMAAESTITLLPKQIELSTTTSFSESGAFQRTQSQLRVSLSLKPHAGMQLAACRGVTLTAATTDTGESIMPSTERGSGNGQESFNEYERDQNNYDINVTLGSPKQAIGAIKMLTGTATIAIADGAAKQATIAPLKDWLGKTVNLDSINEEITVERSSEGTTLRGSRELFDRLQKVTFTDGTGHEIKVNGWSGGSNNGSYERTWSAQIPDDGGLTMQFMPELKEVVVPFSFADLPLKSTNAEKKPVATIKVTDVPGPTKPKPTGVTNPNGKAGGF